MTKNGAISGTDGRSKWKTNSRAFPLTRWSIILTARESDGAPRDQAYDYLCGRYWKPVYCFIRRLGFEEKDAQDLVQDFFLHCLTRDVFGKADPALGRFRNFLLAALKNFIKKSLRAITAQKRKPPGGIVPIDDLSPGARAGLKSPNSDSPDEVYHRVWSRTLIDRVLRLLEDECRTTGKQIHYEIFRQRIVLPALEGSKQPSYRELAVQLGITEKQASNRLLTARSAFQRLMANEIQEEVASEGDAKNELRDLLHFIGDTHA